MQLPELVNLSPIKISCRHCFCKEIYIYIIYIYIYIITTRNITCRPKSMCKPETKNTECAIYQSPTKTQKWRHTTHIKYSQSTCRLPLVQFSLYEHKGGLKPHSFQFLHAGTSKYRERGQQSLSSD